MTTQGDNRDGAATVDYAGAGPGRVVPVDSPMRRNVLFALALVTLAGGAARMQLAKSRGELQLIKKPMPIRKPIVDLDFSSFAPWKMVSGERMRPEMAEELGTTEYGMWSLRNEAATDPDLRQAEMFVSYYTGVQDQVPHVPEECNAVAGWLLKSDRTIDGATLAGEKTSVRCVVFSPPASGAIREGDYDKYIYYVISVNGELFTARNPARFKMADPRDKYLYYSKVELTFIRKGTGGVEALDAAAIGLLDKSVKELFRSHWPAKGAERASDGK